MLAPGTRLGPYEIGTAIGAGGMGEVYRARDTRLHRDVAIKVLADHLAREAGFEERFSREARAVASLNHQNIVAIHDIGTESGTMYAVMELLEGQTLRHRLSRGQLPVRKAVELAAQVADALGAAHHRGVVHRDIKPENIFITSDGRAKVLDFGLAHHDAGKSDAAASDLTTVQQTEPGTILGTAGYMSPEQVRGEVVDHRSDVFALGCTLYEMLDGRGAFRRRTSADTMAAILREDPPPLTAAPTPLPPALVQLVHRCLEKEPQERFQSMPDLAFALRTLTTSETSGPRPSAVLTASKKRTRWLLAPALVLAGTALGLLIHSLLATSPAPLQFRKITFRQGTIFSARFAPDGNSIIYGAAWSGKPVQLYSTRPDGRESRAFGIEADVLGISASGEMALSLGRASLMSLLTAGRLARAPLSGGAPREILDGVVDADWSPDGSALAVTREVDGEARLEYPIGRLRYRGPGYFSSPRISPDGALVAFIEHPVKGDDRGSVSTVDESGVVKRLATDMSAVTGLAWSPDGREIWFSATPSEGGNSIEAVTPSGARRLVARLGVRAKLFDMLGSRALIGIERGQVGSAGLLRGDTIERDLSWLDGTAVMDISDNGDRILFNEGWDGGGPRYSFFLRRVDEDAAVRLGEGVGGGLSRDGRWVIAYLADPTARLSIVPTGPGEPRTIELPGFEAVFGAAWFADGVRLLVWTNEPGQPVGAYVTDVKGAKPRPITGSGFLPPVFGGAEQALSRDGRFLAATNAAGQIELFPVDGGARRTVPGIKPGEQMVAWLGDGHHVLVRERRGLPNRVFRVAIDTGRREPWRELMPLDPAGVLDVLGLVTTPDGEYYAYSYIRAVTDLYLLEGLR